MQFASLGIAIIALGLAAWLGLWVRYLIGEVDSARDMAAEAYAAADIAGHWAIGAAIQAGDDEAVRIIGDVWHGEC